ncbi:hypothetical protein HYH03_009655 [Edaphochlamys debaryana]|uniref:Uncharacterized protein n=1 Tax=Edaphochlamys debaryana TaxID=47281 RepID=A0A836BWV9_9CHLO|nr:hypothetical protein HYH03_009655 [Edaphochlamys debaryana]|eukprot:KAG2491920.1 hypothetical protein HYH03_009655 [Edaphochlamys debaryana]
MGTPTQRGAPLSTCLARYAGGSLKDVRPYGTAFPFLNCTAEFASCRSTNAILAHIEPPKNITGFNYSANQTLCFAIQAPIGAIDRTPFTPNETYCSLNFSSGGLLELRLWNKGVVSGATAGGTSVFIRGVNVSAWVEWGPNYLSIPLRLPGAIVTMPGNGSPSPICLVNKGAGTQAIHDYFKSPYTEAGFYDVTVDPKPPSQIDPLFPCSLRDNVTNCTFRIEATPVLYSLVSNYRGCCPACTTTFTYIDRPCNLTAGKNQTCATFGINAMCAKRVSTTSCYNAAFYMSFCGIQPKLQSVMDNFAARNTLPIDMELVRRWRCGHLLLQLTPARGGG